MKKILLPLLSLSLALSVLTACSTTGTQNTSASSVTAEASATSETTASTPAATESVEKNVGTKLEGFKIQNQKGEEVDLLSVLDKEKPTYLTIWTSWCSVCNKQYPQLEEISKDAEISSKISFVMLNATSGENSGDEPKAQAEAYLQNNGYTLPVYFDIDGENYRNVSISLGLESIPTSFLISPDGTVLKAIVGGTSSVEELKESLNALLAQ